MSATRRMGCDGIDEKSPAVGVGLLGGVSWHVPRGTAFSD